MGLKLNLSLNNGPLPTPTVFQLTTAAAVENTTTDEIAESAVSTHAMQCRLFPSYRRKSIVKSFKCIGTVVCLEFFHA